MLLTNVIRSASYEALPNHRLFPATSGLTSRFPLRNRCAPEDEARRRSKDVGARTPNRLALAKNKAYRMARCRSGLNVYIRLFDLSLVGCRWCWQRVDRLASVQS